MFREGNPQYNIKLPLDKTSLLLYVNTMDWRIFSIAVEKDRYEKLRELSFKQRVSMSSLVRDALELYFKKLGIRFKKAKKQ